MSSVTAGSVACSSTVTVDAGLVPSDSIRATAALATGSASAPCPCWPATTSKPFWSALSCTAASTGATSSMDSFWLSFDESAAFGLAGSVVTSCLTQKA